MAPTYHSEQLAQTDLPAQQKDYQYARARCRPSFFREPGNERGARLARNTRPQYTLEPVKVLPGSRSGFRNTGDHVIHCNSLVQRTMNIPLWVNTVGTQVPGLAAAFPDGVRLLPRSRHAGHRVHHRLAPPRSTPLLGFPASCSVMRTSSTHQLAPDVAALTVERRARKPRSRSMNARSMCGVNEAISMCCPCSWL